MRPCATARAWWAGEKGKRRFLWVHLYDPHAAYDPPEPFASRYRDDPYLGEVAAADSFLAPLLAPWLGGGIHHIGSTAVPGLAAKPIVDILVTVADPDDESAFVPALERAGYALRVREPGHRMLRTPELDVHVHVWREGSADAERDVALRDRLRANAADRAAYEALKRSLAERDWEDMNHYADAKGALIREIRARAGRGQKCGFGKRRRRATQRRNGGYRKGRSREVRPQVRSRAALQRWRILA